MRHFAAKAVLSSAAFLAAATSWTNVAQAELVTYTIDPLQSTLTLLGNLTGNTASQQTAGSLTTSYSGTIVANRTTGAIEFPGGSLMNAALQSSNQQPRNDGTNGSQPADYGRTAPGPFSSTTLEAIRNIELDVFDDTFGTGITVAGNGAFASNSLQIQIDNGESDSLYGNVSNPDIDLSGKGTSNGSGNGPSSVVVTGSTETLTLKFSTGPIGYSIAQSNDSSISFFGTIVAMREVPEPSAAGAVLIIGGSLLARRGRRSC
ncbi:MAG: hypothetical protein QOE14_2569 [Humisphaera sp.]|nr:hypothetical protein [Humisphaera sp.]